MPACRCDGIGRRDGLKIRWWRHRAGSTPATGTTSSRTMYRSRRLFHCNDRSVRRRFYHVIKCTLSAGRYFISPAHLKANFAAITAMISLIMAAATIHMHAENNNDNNKRQAQQGTVCSHSFCQNIFRHGICSGRTECNTEQQIVHAKGMKYILIDQQAARQYADAAPPQELTL